MSTAIRIVGKYYKVVALTILAVVTLISIFTTDFQQLSWEFIGPMHKENTAWYFRQDNFDIPPLILRTSQCTTFIQTRSYWHEDYTPKIAFYRPLSLTWFWFEYHHFGPNNYSSWTAVSLALHALFLVLLAAFLWEHTKSIAAVLLTLLFFAGLPQLASLLQLNSIVSMRWDSSALLPVVAWKDQPTLLADSACMFALIFAKREKWVAGIFFSVVGVLFKESGWFTWVLVFLMLLATGRLSKLPTWVYFGAVIGIAIPMILRSAAHMGVVGGYRVGANYEWKVRYINAMIGCFLAGGLHGPWPALFLGIALCSLTQWKSKSVYVYLLAAIVITFLSGILMDIVYGTTVIVGLVMLTDPASGISNEILGFVFGAGVFSLFKEKDLGKFALLLVIFSLIVGFGYVSALQVNVHALHLCYAFQCGATALGFVAIYRVCRDRILVWVNSRRDFASAS
jgi:hypothetical protein